MLLKAFSTESISWMYFKLPDTFKVAFMNAQRDEHGKWSIWAIKGTKDDAVDVVYDFDVLFSNGDTLFNFNSDHKERVDTIIECRVVLWKDAEDAFHGVGIVGQGYIINENGKTIEKI